MNESKPSDGSGSTAKDPASAALQPGGGSSGDRRALSYLAGVALIFLLGFVPMWFKAASREKERDAARRALRLTQVQLALASAAIDAQRGEYERARLSAIDFFTGLTAEMQPGADSAIPAAQFQTLQSLFQQRDTLVTLLARSDPAAAGRLSNLYVAFRQGAGK